MAAVAQPSGTVTLVFTDIEGSTRLLDELGVDRYREALAEHRRIVRDACARHDGYEVDYEGDAFFYAFSTAQAAVSAVGEAMRGLDGGPIKIRVGIHTGEPSLDPPKYVGIDVHRAARIMSAAHGGQVVLSRETAEVLDDGVELKDLGEHRFKDLGPAERIHQLGHTDHPPLKSLFRVTLPVPVTPFLGREHELAAVADLLTDTDTRLLTLTGPGGTGKTRLALQAAAETADRFPDGVTWVALAPLRDPALLVPTIARAQYVNEQPGEELASTLATALLGKKALLLLDNAEHLLPRAAHDLAALLTACPTLRVLVTSRERLRIGAETTWPVPPLTAGDGERLFVERARAAGVELDADDTLILLCRRLDQLPLAIELAAARTRMLSPAAIHQRLDQRLDVLSTRDRDVVERQRTLEATIAWSYDLLDPDEQRALRALSTFAGGCTLDAAQHVAEADLVLIESLLDKSLLRHRLDDAGDDRYWMLETIREYAQQRLLDDADEAEAVLEAFVGWLDGVVGEIDEYWIERDQLEWLRTLDRERANLMHAVALCRTRDRHARALRLLLAADQFVDARGPYAPFAELLESLCSGDARLDRLALHLRLRLLIRMGRNSEVRETAEASAAGAGGDPAADGRLLSLRSFNAIAQGEPELAETLAARAVELTRLALDRRGVADALVSHAVARMTHGDIAGGLADLRESQRLSEQLGDRRNAAIARTNMALTLLADRRHEEACALLHECLVTVRSIGDPFLLSVQLGNLAIGLAAAGDGSGARAALREALELGLPQFDDSLRIEGLLLLAIAAAHERLPGRAIALWAAGERLREDTGYVLGPELEVYMADWLEPLRAEREFERHWDHGRSLSADEAIELGLHQIQLVD